MLRRTRLGGDSVADETGFFGCVEAGGTKIIVAIGDRAGKIHAESRIPTADPESTLAAARGFLREQAARLGPFTAIGIGSFGPVHLDAASPRYGHIGQTPKPGWSGTDMVGAFAAEFACPVAFDTDVNAAACAEHRWGAARDVSDLVYLTIGTGIGGGVMVGGLPVHGLMHPEIGHVYTRRHPLDTEFAGVCPFHGDCVEGLASGTAILGRCGVALDRLPDSHPQWSIEADYLGQLCAQLTLTLSPARIIMGGGVMQQLRLLPMIRARAVHWLGGYVDRPEIHAHIDRYIVPPALGASAGILGALALAMGAV